MLKFLKKYYFCVNAINYTLCELYAYKNYKLLQMVDNVKLFFLSIKYKGLVFSRRYYSKYERNSDMEFFDLRLSYVFIIVLFTPISLCLSKLVTYFFQFEIFFVYIFFEILLTFPIWKYTFDEKNYKRQFRMYERLSGRYLHRWRLLLLSIIILDIFLIILLNLM